MEEKSPTGQDASMGPTLKRTKEEFNFEQKLNRRAKNIKNEILTGLKAESSVEQ